MCNALELVQNEDRRAFYKAVLYMLIYWFDFPLSTFLMNSLLSRRIGIIKQH
jgi:hypothetical protein